MYYAQILFLSSSLHFYLYPNIHTITVDIFPTTSIIIAIIYLYIYNSTHILNYSLLNIKHHHSYLISCTKFRYYIICSRPYWWSSSFKNLSLHFSKASRHWILKFRIIIRTIRIKILFYLICSWPWYLMLFHIFWCFVFFKWWDWAVS